MDSARHDYLERRFRMLHALRDAVDRRDEVLKAVEDCVNRDEATEALAEEFGWDKDIAVNVLSMRAWYFTAPGKREIDEELADVRFQLGMPNGRKKPPTARLDLPHR